VSYKINQQNVSFNDLGTRLSTMFSLRAEKIMSIQAESNLEFSTVAQVVDIAKGSGADHVGLMTSKDPLYRLD
jgi:biopolymer transport protein ExbD